MVTGGLRNVLKGKTTRKDGSPYTKYFTNKIWKGLEDLVQNPYTYKAIHTANNTGSEELFKVLMGKDVCTLTGRIRGKVGFTQACNTPFSGLAADGAKLAMWNLFQVGFRVVGFIHDEILVEITEDSDWSDEIRLINNIVCESMQELTGTIPITCEYSLSRVWSKEAKAVYDGKGKIQIWEYNPTEHKASSSPEPNSIKHRSDTTRQRQTTYSRSWGTPEEVDSEDSSDPVDDAEVESDVGNLANAFGAQTI